MDQNLQEAMAAATEADKAVDKYLDPEIYDNQDYFPSIEKDHWKLIELEDQLEMYRSAAYSMKEYEDIMLKNKVNKESLE